MQDSYSDRVAQLGVTHKLANCTIVRVDIDTEHYYFSQDKDGNTEYFISLTRVLDIGAPFPEGLRDYLRMSTMEESKQRLEMTGARGLKLHDANERLMAGEALNLEQDYQTSYEKQAITTFIRLMRFLRPEKFQTELIVADPKIRVAGTLDLACTVEAWKLEALMNPTKYLEFDSESDMQLKEQYLPLVDTMKRKQRIIIDYKYTGRNTYNHKVQVSAYKTMHNKSRPQDGYASRAFIYRNSSMHKFGFDFQEAHAHYNDFKRIYNTAIAYLGEFPEPPKLIVYPKQVRLFDKVNNKEKKV